MNEDMMRNMENHINEIMATSEQKEYLQSMKTMSHGIAIFYLELQLQGIGMAEALMLTQEYVRTAFGKPSQN